MTDKIQKFLELRKSPDVVLLREIESLSSKIDSIPTMSDSLINDVQSIKEKQNEDIKVKVSLKIT